MQISDKLMNQSPLYAEWRKEMCIRDRGWPSVTAGWGWDAGIKPGLHNIINYAQTTALTMTANVSSLSGTKCIGVCLVARSSVQATTHVTVNSVSYTHLHTINLNFMKLIHLWFLQW